MASILKAEGEARLEHVRRGGAVCPKIVLAMKDGERAVSRSLGAPRKAGEVRLEWLGGGSPKDSPPNDCRQSPIVSFQPI